MCPSTKSTLEWSVSGEFLGNEREEEKEDITLRGMKMRRDRQTERHSDKEFQVKERASQVESPRWRGAGKGKEEKRGGQAQTGGRDARRRDRQTDWLPRAQTERLMPSDEIEMQGHQPRRGVGRDRWRQVPARRDSNHAH